MNKKRFIIFVCFLSVFTSSLIFSQINFDWAKYYSPGSTINAEAKSMCTDNAGNVYIIGNVSGTIYKLLKYNTDGNQILDINYNYGPANEIIYNGSSYFFAAGGNGLIKLNSEGNLTLVKSGNIVDIEKGQDNFIYSVSGNNYSITTDKFSLNGSLIWTQIKPGTFSGSYYPYRIFQGVNNKINVMGRSIIIFSFYTYSGTVFMTYDTLGNLIYDYDMPSGSLKEVRDNYSHNNFFIGYRDYSVWQSDLLMYKVDSSNVYIDTLSYNGTGNGRDEPFDIVSDNSGGIYVACRSWGVAVDYDFVVLKFNTNGNLLWEYRYNGSENSYDAAVKLKLDNYGNVYASGTVTLNAHGIQIYTVKLSPYGELLWSDKFSRYNSITDSNFVNDLQLDNNGNVLICGKSRNPATFNYDFLTLKYSNTTSINSKTITIKDFNVLPNYPNPFNPETNLKFILSKSAAVKIKIFNITGKELTELVNSKFSEGEHSIKWDASAFPSGVYFISFESDNFKVVRKAVLNK